MSQVPARNTVQFYRGDKGNLPLGAKEIELYMIPGEDNIYVVFKEEKERALKMGYEIKNQILKSE